MGAKVRAYDPAGMEQAKTVLGNVTFCQDAYDCAKGASALVIVTEWEQFRALDFERLKERDGAAGAGRSAQYLSGPRKSLVPGLPMRAWGGLRNDHSALRFIAVVVPREGGGPSNRRHR